MATNANEHSKSKATIEIHMENLIKGHQDLWMGYKKRLVHVHKVLEELKAQHVLSVSKGDSFIRFKSVSDHAGLNSLFFIYEIGSVFPNLMWRHLIDPKQGFNYILLTKPISCLPAFSFSLDQQTTLLYWGEQVPFLSTSDLRSLKLSNLVLKVNSPSSVDVSVANFVWPKSAYPLMNPEFKRLAVYYLFNSLMPPVLDTYEVWSEAPFILVGDKTVNFLTIHKTLCSVNMNTVMNLRDKNTVSCMVKVIDHSFTLRRIHVNIPDNCIDEFSKRTLHEVICVKTMKFRYSSPMTDKSYTIYPFESVKLFGKDYGWLLSVVSMILRKYYLLSDNPFYFIITPKEFKMYLSKILPLLSDDHVKELGLRLVENTEGLHTLASMLGVYISDDHYLTYLHPGLLECFLSSFEDQVTVTKTNLKKFQRIASIYAQRDESLGRLEKVFLIEDLFKQEFDLNLNYDKARQLMKSIHNLIKVYIPFSKRIKQY